MIYIIAVYCVIALFVSLHFVECGKSASYFIARGVFWLPLLIMGIVVSIPEIISDMMSRD
jgi:hypothetical protein